MLTTRSYLSHSRGPSTPQYLANTENKPHRAADTGSLIQSLDTDLVFIPANCTSICQPRDVSVNALFKKKIIDFWVEWRRQPAARTAAGNLKQPTRQHVINWISTAWEELADDIIKKSFLRCGISNALDDSHDDEIRTDIPLELEDEESEHLQDPDDVTPLLMMKIWTNLVTTLFIVIVKSSTCVYMVLFYELQYCLLACIHSNGFVVGIV